MNNDSTTPRAEGQAAHTPTPWRISAAGNIRPDDGTKAGKVIASPQREQDAAFIVRACNSHAALVEALKETVNQLETIRRDRPGHYFTNERTNMVSAALAQARAALAAAKSA